MRTIQRSCRFVPSLWISQDLSNLRLERGGVYFDVDWFSCLSCDFEGLFAAPSLVCCSFEEPGGCLPCAVVGGLLDECDVAGFGFGSGVFYCVAEVVILGGCVVGLTSV